MIFQPPGQSLTIDQLIVEFDSSDDGFVNQFESASTSSPGIDRPIRSTERRSQSTATSCSTSSTTGATSTYRGHSRSKFNTTRSKLYLITIEIKSRWNKFLNTRRPGLSSSRLLTYNPLCTKSIFKITRPQVFSNPLTKIQLEGKGLKWTVFIP